MALRSWLFSLSFLLLIAASPQQAHHADGPDELLWFLVVSDSHVGADLVGGNQDTENLAWAASVLVDTVQPRFLVNAGDLTDGTGGGLFPTGPKDEEWSGYRAILDEHGMTDDFYFDLPGNHDQYSDLGLPHYLGYSIQGEAHGAANYDWSIEAGGWKYLFLGVDTTGSDGAPWPADNAGLDGSDFEAMYASLDAAADADIVVMFGHHPATTFYFNDGLSEFRDVFDDQLVSAYIFGHTHDFSTYWESDTLQLNIRSLGKSPNLQVGLVAFDGLGLSAKGFDVDDWPQVLVTAPLDSGLGGSHPYDYMVSASAGPATIRALAFHPDGVENVVAIIDNTTSVALSVEEDNIWQGTFDPSDLDEYAHSLKVIATAGGEGDEHVSSFYVFHDPEAPEPADCVEWQPDAGSEDAGDLEVIEDVGADWQQPYEVFTQDTTAALPGADLGDPPEFDYSAGFELEVQGDAWSAEPAAPVPTVKGYIKDSRDQGCGTNGSPAARTTGLLFLAALSGLVLLRRSGIELYYD